MGQGCNKGRSGGLTKFERELRRLEWSVKFKDKGTNRMCGIGGRDFSSSVNET